jgi:hypothetical protein
MEKSGMQRFGLSVGGLSIAMAVALAVWEVLFLFLGWQGVLGLFVPNQLGFQIAWMSVIYLAFQLLSIPFAMRASRGRFIGAVDGMASLLPLLVVVVVIFGRPHLLGTPERWSAAFLLLLVTATDLFGGYVFNIALSRRMFDVGGAAAE